jgi:hypothetical protein
MNHFLIAFKEEQANVKYCIRCLAPKSENMIGVGCCGENYWMEFKHFDDETQQRIAEEEYEWHHHRNQK